MSVNTDGGTSDPIRPRLVSCAHLFDFLSNVGPSSLRRFFLLLLLCSRFFRVRTVFNDFVTPLLDTCTAKIFTGVDGGLSGGSSMRRPGSEEHHRRQQKFG